MFANIQGVHKWRAGCSVDGPSPAEIECSDNEDGSADVTYLPPVAGEYAVHVLCDDDDITGSPFIVDVRPTPSTNFDPSKVCLVCIQFL